MLNPSEVYIDGIKQRFNYIATWLPNVEIRLGDVGLFEGKYFRHQTSLEALKIPFTLREGTETVDFLYNSEAGLSVSTRLNARDGTARVGRAGVEIAFGEEGAFLFHAAACTVDEIEDRFVLGQSVIEKFHSREWEREWRIVDTVVKSGSATILVSNSARAKLELTATGVIDPMNLAKFDANFSIRSQSGEITRFVAAKGLVPMFRVSQLRRTLLRPLRLRSGGQAMQPTANEEGLERFFPD